MAPGRKTGWIRSAVTRESRKAASICPSPAANRMLQWRWILATRGDWCGGDASAVAGSSGIGEQLARQPDGQPCLAAPGWPPPAGWIALLLPGYTG